MAPPHRVELFFFFNTTIWRVRRERELACELQPRPRGHHRRVRHAARPARGPGTRWQRLPPQRRRGLVVKSRLLVKPQWIARLRATSDELSGSGERGAEIPISPPDVAAELQRGAQNVFYYLAVVVLQLFLSRSLSPPHAFTRSCAQCSSRALEQERHKTRKKKRSIDRGFPTCSSPRAFDFVVLPHQARAIILRRLSVRGALQHEQVVGPAHAARQLARTREPSVDARQPNNKRKKGRPPRSVRRVPAAKRRLRDEVEVDS